MKFQFDTYKDRHWSNPAFYLERAHCAAQTSYVHLRRVQHTSVNSNGYLQHGVLGDFSSMATRGEWQWQVAVSRCSIKGLTYAYIASAECP